MCCLAMCCQTVHTAWLHTAWLRSCTALQCALPDYVLPDYMIALHQVFLKGHSRQRTPFAGSRIITRGCSVTQVDARSDHRWPQWRSSTSGSCVSTAWRKSKPRSAIVMVHLRSRTRAIVKCLHCKSSARTVLHQKTSMGRFHVERKCKRCQGANQVHLLLHLLLHISAALHTWLFVCLLCSWPAKECNLSTATTTWGHPAWWQEWETRLAWSRCKEES